MSKLYISASTTVGTGVAYATGDNVAGKISLTDARFYGLNGLAIRGIGLSDTSKQSAQTDVVFFHTNPSTSTFTDNVAQTIADAEIGNILGIVNIPAANYAAFVDNSFAYVQCNVPLYSSTTILYAVLVTRGTPTYTEAGALQLKVLVGPA